MAFLPGVQTINTLTTSQPVTSSATVTTIQNSSTDSFSFSLAAGKRITFRVQGSFSLGATGGFRFQVTNSQSSALYLATYEIGQGGASTAFFQSLTAQAAFNNASANAANYTLLLYGTITQGATNGLVSVQFAQNTSDALPITMLAGTSMVITQTN